MTKSPTKWTEGKATAFPSAFEKQISRVWAHREKIEHEAADLFSRIASSLTELGASPKVAALAQRAYEDEKRHAIQCKALALSLNPHAEFSNPCLGVPLGPEAMSLEDQALYACVAVGCVTETLSTALLIEMWQLAEYPLAKQTIHSILKDEILHSRIGWAHLAWQSAKTDVRWISVYLKEMIEEAIGSETAQTGHDFSAWGVLPRQKAHGIMTQTLQTTVLPGLKAFGIAL